MGGSSLLSKGNDKVRSEVKCFVHLVRWLGSWWCCIIAVRHFVLVLLKAPEMSCVSRLVNFILLVLPIPFERLRGLSEDSIAWCRLVVIASTAELPVTAPHWA